MAEASGAPRASLSVLDGVAMIVGIVIGIGIFKTPPLVAANVSSEAAFVGAWVLGGVLSIFGALVYAQLSAAFPSTGGEYHFLNRAFGQAAGFLFAWARISVIQTGAIAAVAFVFGDYAQQIFALGPFGSALYAAIAVIVLSLVNVKGTFFGKQAQNVFAALTLLALLTVALVGFAASDTAGPITPPATGRDTPPATGLAMVFILLTYGGWNEAAYLSADIRNPHRNMARVLLTGLAIVIVAYVLINVAYLHVLGFQGMRTSKAVAADLMRQTLGERGALVLSAVICCAAVSTLNATIFTGARIYHALGQDLKPLQRLGLWHSSGNNPRPAILIQALIVLALILFGAFSKDGFRAMVEYTAPVFWLFLLLVGIAYFILRRRHRDAMRTFQPPMRLVEPIVFCLTCAYLFYSSLAYTGRGALVGVTVLLIGIPVLAYLRRACSPG